MNEGEGAAGVEPIAVIGLACRVPGARNAGQFWENLVGGVQARTELPVSGTDPDVVPVAYLLDEVENFDAGLFGMTPREAALTDPQHRLFLELCHSALLDAGQDPARYNGDIGVYGGRGLESYRWTYLNRNRETADDPLIGSGNHPDTLTALTSYRLNLTGPSVGIYTACSTSLVAVHLASEALRAGECDLALAGGVNIELPADRGYPYREGGVCAVDGWCRPFDAAATGIVPGSGGGVVLLKRLSDAIADGDPVRAVVSGNAINNDGAGKVSFAALSVDGQAAVIAGALAVGDIDPRTVGYVEAHGAATTHGDEIELAALTSVYGPASPDRQWCAIGSVKPNVGHLSQGAGVVGLIKTVLCLENGVIPASLGYRTPNQAIDFPSTPFYVNETLAAWEPAGTPRRAAVSSFGIGGTNAHVIIEEAPATERLGTARPAELIQLSARSAAALDVAVRELADHLSATELDLADVAHTLRAGRATYEHRTAVVAKDLPAAVSALRQPKRLSETAGAAHRVAFLFPGEGSPRFTELYAAEPAFASAIDACAEELDDLHDLRGVFAVGYALGILWQSWGVRPATMIGHGIGELVAATLAGVFELPDALRLVQTYARLVDTMPDGAMLAVSAEVEPPAGVSVAAVNGPGTRVLSGPTELITRFADELAEGRVKARRLPGTRALHSAMVDPLLAELRAVVQAAGPREPHTEFYSGRTGAPITTGQATDPGYWAALLREPVCFGDCLADLLAGPEPVLLLECGPGRQLSGFAQMRRAAAVHSLPGEAGGEVACCYAAAGRLWVSGVELAGFGAPGRKVALPGYPYERQRHWIDPDPVVVAQPTVSDTFTVPGWRRLAPLVSPALPARLGVIIAGPVGKDLVARLEAAGVTVRTEPDPTVPHWVHAGALDGEAPGFAGMTTVITVGAHRVLGTETVRPVLPGGAARLVDAELDRLDDLVTELGTATSDGPVALRSGYRWAPRPEPIALPDPTGPARRYGTVGDLGRFAPAVSALPSAGVGDPDALLVGAGADPAELHHPAMILLSDAGTATAARFDAYAHNHPGTRSVTLAPGRSTVDELTAALHRVLAAHLDGCVTITLDEAPEDEPPADDIEARLTAIWLNLFGGNDVRIGDDFFTLGGNSLLATALVTQVRKAFGVRLPMRTVFDAPTVAGMAAKVAELRAKKK